MDKKLDYSVIKKEFEKQKKDFPLLEEDCIGLTEKEKNEMNPCGTYCGKCEDYGVVCDGCRNRKGKPIWYDLFGRKDVCSYYDCTQKQGIHDCSLCKKVPCAKHFVFPDPNMSDDFKQYWFKLRMENFNKENPNLNLEVKDTYDENENKYLSKKE